MEIILGRERRRWSASQKRAIVAETIAAGEVARVARRHGANPAMVFAWRKQFGGSAIEASRAPAFAPVEVIAPLEASGAVRRTPIAPLSPPAIIASPAEASAQSATASSASALIDVEIGADIRLRIRAGAEPALAAAVAKALRG